MNLLRKHGGWRRVLHVGVIFAFWIGLAVVSLSNSVLAHASSACQDAGLRGALLQLPTLMRQDLPPFLLWALLTPLLFRASRWTIDRHVRSSGAQWRHDVAMHIGLAVLVVLGVGVFKAVVHNLLTHVPLDRHPWQDWLLSRFYIAFQFDLVIYLAIIAAGAAIAYYKTYKERKQHAAELEAERARLQMLLAQAQLQNLRMQINPHFLFNTLNTVAALVERDAAGTRRTVARLSTLLRRALESTEEQEVPLSEELHFVESYLEIEHIRFQDRLDLRIFAEPEAREAMVPNLLFQPLVENAVHHGIAHSTEPGYVEVEARRRGGRLYVWIRDSGPGISGDGAPALKEGVGLGNTRSRLQHLYGYDASLRFRTSSSGGTVVEIALPFRPMKEALPRVGMREEQP